ncbi:hypothetical protein CTI12_AA294960 [Artemisia annua]|uniref:Uncharacterized protein n=1 Tax=Artemisia annua TaxID=35608 RepID=A0A2U1N8E2_ARTAN|nr:hypothetical protein CTI12_AA294960 [Artemisia annua]
MATKRHEINRPENHVKRNMGTVHGSTVLVSRSLFVVKNDPKGDMMSERDLVTKHTPRSKHIPGIMGRCDMPVSDIHHNWPRRIMETGT